MGSIMVWLWLRTFTPRAVPAGGGIHHVPSWFFLPPRPQTCITAGPGGLARGEKGPLPGPLSATFLSPLIPCGDPRVMVVGAGCCWTLKRGERTYVIHNDEQNSVNQLISTFNNIY